MILDVLYLLQHSQALNAELYVFMLLNSVCKFEVLIPNVHKCKSAWWCRSMSGSRRRGTNSDFKYNIVRSLRVFHSVNIKEHNTNNIAFTCHDLCLWGLRTLLVASFVIWPDNEVTQTYIGPREERIPKFKSFNNYLLCYFNIELNCYHCMYFSYKDIHYDSSIRVDECSIKKYVQKIAKHHSIRQVMV